MSNVQMMGRESAGENKADEAYSQVLTQNLSAETVETYEKLRLVQLSGRVSNPGCCKYEAGLLPSQPICSVSEILPLVQLLLLLR
jgi:hypothetical protein